MNDNLQQWIICILVLILKFYTLYFSLNFYFFLWKRGKVEPISACATTPISNPNENLYLYLCLHLWLYLCLYLYFVWLISVIILWKGKEGQYPHVPLQYPARICIGICICTGICNCDCICICMTYQWKGKEEPIPACATPISGPNLYWNLYLYRYM